MLPEASIWQHEPWNDENGPRHYMYAGNPSTCQGEQYTARYGGARRTPLNDVFTGHYCGTPDQWAGNLLVARPSDHGDPACCFEVPPVAEDSWWAKITACTISDPKYGHVEVLVSGADGSNVVLTGGRGGTLEDGPAWEGNRQYAVPVGAVVRMWHGSDGEGFFFARGNLMSEVMLESSTPDHDELYDARLLVWDSVEQPGQLYPADEAIWALDLAGRGINGIHGPHHARYLGTLDGRPTYAFRAEAGGSGGDCASCNVLRDDVADISELDAGDFTEGTHVYIPNYLTGAVGHWVAMRMPSGNPLGWIDLCQCSVPWWCTEDGCINQAWTPEEYLSGPWPSLDCCQEECEGVPCCPGDLPPTLPSEMFGVFSAGIDCSCLNEEIAPVTSIDGTVFAGSLAHFCGSGMGNLQFFGECVELVPGYHRWKLTYQWVDGDDEDCNRLHNDPSYAIRGGGYTFSCSPVDMTFPIKVPGPCCGGGGDDIVVYMRLVESLPMADALVAAMKASPSGIKSTFTTRGDQPTLVSLPLVSNCIHLKEKTDLLLRCEGCRGARLRVFGCEVHGSCTTDTREGKRANGVMSCGDCMRGSLGYTPPAEGT